MPGAEFRLPSGFITARSLLDAKVQDRSKVNFIGLVTDYRAPVATRGKDWKCQIRLYDSSTEFDTDSIAFNVFRPENDMPFASCGNVVLIYQATVQVQTGYGLPSLLTNFNTSIHVYISAKIPKPPADASCALRPPTGKSRTPDDKDHMLVSSFFKATSKDRLPSETEFELMTAQSTKIREKFSLLKDVRETNFYDLVVQVVKNPYDQGDKITLWVSDYTENSSFFHFTFAGAEVELEEEPSGDPYGYTTKFRKPLAGSPGDWKGPFGKRSMQITCYEPHATALREDKTTLNHWVLLKNVQVKYGHNGSNLEGFLREDRGFGGTRIGVSLMEMTDADGIDPRLKDCLRRKREYEKAKKGQLKSITEAAAAGQKRKASLTASAEPKKNTKTRRKKARAQAKLSGDGQDPVKTSAQDQVKAEPSLVPDLNVRVKCENQNKPASSIAKMLESVSIDTVVGNDTVKLQLPFVNVNYRANVRVVDFMPPRLEEFARLKKVSEFDILSDNGEEGKDSSSESESELDEADMANEEGGKWEWRFYLKLEDVTVADKQRMSTWVAVDNFEAQCLTSLDASNLRRDSENLESLRQKMFILWGELEEHKTREQAKEVELRKAARNGQCPEHSDDEKLAPASVPKINSRPFSCCIRQYGISVPERDPAKTDAGEGRRWKRMYGLFGTRICG